MKQVKKIISKEQIKKEQEILDLFSYKVIDIKERKNDFVIKFEIKELDDKYALYLNSSSKSVVPFFPVIIFASLAILLITSLLVLYVVNKKITPLDIKPFLYGLGAPAFIFLFASVLWTMYKSKIDVHNINLNTNIEDLKTKIESLKRRDK